MSKNRIISRSEVCLLTGISGSSMRKYISRGDLIEIEKNRIDLDNEKNKSTILGYASKKGLDLQINLYPELVKEEVKHEEPKPEPIKKEVQEKPEISKKEKPKKDHTDFELRKTKVEREVEKIEIDTKLKRLELDKKNSKVLPLDFVIEWSSLNIKGIFSEDINFGNSIIDQICNELDADIEVRLKYKRKFKEGFGEILKSGIKNQKTEAVAQAKEYSLQSKW